MATPVNDSHSVASGGVIAAGRFGYIANTVALIGDSLTADSYGLSTFPMLNARSGGRLKLLANSAVASETVQMMLARVNNDYLNVAPGVAGLGPIGRIFVRAGTNNARTNATIASISAAYTSLLNALVGYAKQVVILAVPPLADATQNGHVVTYNAWLQAFAASNARCLFVDDCINVRNGDNSQIARFFNEDGVHFLHLGTAQVAVDASDQLAALGDYASPFSVDPLDVYPAQPQWLANPFNAGTAGTFGGSFSGVAATGMSVSGNGAGMAGVASIVAADTADANQTPWQRLEITSGQLGSNADIQVGMTGRTLTSSEPSSLEVLAEVRLINLDRTKISNLQMFVQANTGDYLSPSVMFDLPDVGIENCTLGLRNNRKRIGSTTPASANLHIYIAARSTFSTNSAGYIDIRRITARG